MSACLTVVFTGVRGGRVVWMKEGGDGGWQQSQRRERGQRDRKAEAPTAARCAPPVGVAKDGEGRTEAI